MKRAVVAVMASLVVACSPAAEDADTMSVATVDTVKAAIDSGTPSPAVGATTAAAPVTGTRPTTAATQTKTGTKSAPVDTTNIGRDRAIPINTKDPKVRLPTVDTTKRPPG